MIFDGTLGLVVDQASRSSTAPDVIASFTVPAADLLVLTRNERQPGSAHFSAHCRTSVNCSPICAAVGPQMAKLSGSHAPMTSVAAKDHCVSQALK
jgi:hypothetical protein